MADGITVEWVGGEAMQQKFRQLSVDVQGEMLYQAARAAAMLVENDAKLICPYVTGNLHRSIKTEDHEIGPGRILLRVGSGEPYARRIEYGFEGKDALGREYHQSAQPYLRPALDANQQAIRETIREAVSMQVRQAFGR